MPIASHDQQMQTPPLGLTALKKNYNSDLFYYIHTLDFMNLGDSNGQKMPLSEYDPKTIQSWVDVIEKLENSRILLPFLMTFYYGYAPQLTPLCVDYLERYSTKNPKEKWRWLAHAIILSRDKKKRERFSKDLSKWGKEYDLPLFAKDAYIRFMSKNNRLEHARSLAKNLLESDQNLSPEERNFLKLLVK